MKHGPSNARYTKYSTPPPPPPPKKERVQEKLLRFKYRTTLRILSFISVCIKR